MSVLSKKIDFVALISVTNANSNGDPLNGNRPRTDYNGYGEISDVCLKRKIRNRMQDKGEPIFVISDDRCTDGFDSLKSRAEAMLGSVGGKKKGGMSEDEYAAKACETFTDVRAFGQVFAFSGSNVSVGVRGPVSVQQAVSLSPVEVNSMQITKSVNGNPADGKAPDTMGMKHFVRFGLYEIKGSINVQLAEKTGFSDADAELLKECLRTLFINDASSARPDGSMEVVKLFWFKHNCKEGQYSSAKVHRSVKAVLKADVMVPQSADDYEISVEPLEGLETEVIDGI